LRPEAVSLPVAITQPAQKRVAKRSTK
jgi:hypothetical protein